MSASAPNRWDRGYARRALDITNQRRGNVAETRAQSFRVCRRWMRRCTTSGSLGRGEDPDRSSSHEGQIPSTEVVLRPHCSHPVKSILMASLLDQQVTPTRPCEK